METANGLLELIVQQGKNVLIHMKDVKRLAAKKGKDRAQVYEKYFANQHSFRVYTYSNPDIKESSEVQNFKEKLNTFNKTFEQVQYEYDVEIPKSSVEPIYEDVLHAYNEMVTALGFSQEVVNIKRF